MVATGPQSDRVGFGEYIQKNMKLYELRNGVSLNGPATANYVRGELARFLRRSPYQVNLLIGAVDEEESPAGGKQTVPTLHWIDYLGSMVKVNFGAHGYASNFCLSIFDREWRVRGTENCIRQAIALVSKLSSWLCDQPDLTLDEAIVILKKCRAELDMRFLVRNGEWSYTVRHSRRSCLCRALELMSASCWVAGH